MKSEFVLTAAKVASQATAAAAAGAAGALAQGAAAPHMAISVALLMLSGVCAVSGALFFRASDTEHPARDTMVTIVFPFLLGVAAGPYFGHWAFGLVPHADGAYQTPLAEHMFGGCVIGVVLTPAMRAAADRIARRGSEK